MATPPPPHGADPQPWPPQQQPVGPYAGHPAQPGPYAAPPQPGPYAGHPAQPGPYAGHPQPGPYLSQPHGVYNAPQPHVVFPPQGAVAACRICGAVPAAPTTVRGHQGFLVIMRFLSLQGPFCRDCGLATLRHMSAKTLWQGWWGPLSVVVTPITLLVNLGPWAAFRKLPTPAGGFRPPLDPGKPLARRPEALLFLVPMLLVALAIPTLIVIGLLVGGDKGSETAPTLSVGSCVRNDEDWPDQDLQVTDCGAPDAEYKVSRRLEEPGSTCADGDFYADLKYGPGGATVSCLEPLR
ncbi:hypothetical protein ACFU5O_08955 [Streptomyces sp. NPDC057445]|uniref:LppU/SCO3897 family protein n=1 Tax=Streptomyces sp. NPDC057445 TaxID=3346136 RepID=UPI00368DA5C6